MPFRANRVIVLRWVFLVAGLFLLGGGGIILGLNTTAQQWAQVMYPGDHLAQRSLLMAVTLISFMVSVLCLASAWGIPRGKSWGRSAGVLASIGLIGMFSPLSLAGFWCLWALAKPLELPAKAESAKSSLQSKDYWVAARQSRERRFVSFSLAVLGLLAMGWVKGYAGRLGIRSWDPGLLSLPLLLLIDVAVHEAGHVAIAWAMENRLAAICAGPFVWRDTGYGYSFSFDWKRVWTGGGFVGSAALTEENLRWKFAAEVAGGPAAALLGSLVATATFLSLPGTSFQSLWWIPGYLAVVFLFDAITNLVPLGYCDGAMLYHLIRWTPEGRLLIGRKNVDRHRYDARVLRDGADFVGDLEVWTPALEEAKASGERNAFAIALCHERLGYAHHALHNWPAAEAQFCRCLEHEPECAFDTALLVNSLSGLQRASFERHHAAEVGRTYAQALTALEKRRKNRDGLSRSVIGVMMARSHFYAGDFAKVLEEAEAALRIVPPGRDRLLLRAEAMSWKACAHYGLGAADLGWVCAIEASEMMQSPEIPRAKRNSAWNDLAEFAARLWRAGEIEKAVELLRDAITGLEKGGAVVAAAQHRIQLASMLRQAGRFTEAGRYLPDQTGLPDCTRRSLLAERARLCLATERPADAITESGWLLLLWQAEPVETALAQSLLAEACLDSGDHQRASEFAHQAAEVLGPWGHYEMASCLVTTALAQWRSDGVWLADYVERARQLIESDSILNPVAKKRLLEEQEARLRRHGVAAALPA
jgi:tetratricopeptide (TPR) repeat protein/Zn-dependent protease